MPSEVILLPNSETRTCDCCGAHDVRMSHETELFNYKNEDGAVVQLSAQVPAWTCYACGEQFTDDRAEDLRHEAVCAYLKRLCPREIKKLRESSALSQVDWASLTGFGVASVKRWESGALIQGLAQDRYMRLLRDTKNLAALQAMQESAHALMPKRAFRTSISAETIMHASTFRLRLSSPT